MPDTEPACVSNAETSRTAPAGPAVTTATTTTSTGDANRSDYPCGCVCPSCRVNTHCLGTYCERAEDMRREATPAAVEYAGGVEWWADCYPQWKGVNTDG